MAAPVVRTLGAESFGLGGIALQRAGTDLIENLETFSSMGVGAVARRSPRIARAALRLLAAAKKRRPPAALLVGYSEFNAWLGPRLRKLGTRVLWYSPPQVWAWRAARAPTLAKSCDRMAVILPFEEELWTAAGCEAHYVGHPALEHGAVDRDAVRARYGMTPYAEYVALLPGSRPQEVREHLQPMLDAVGLLRAERGALDARVILAPSLPQRVHDQALKRAADAGIATIDERADRVLSAFDVALAASGTVTLECALAGVPPVIVYRTGPLTELVARRWVSVSDVGLPNVVLGRRVFPELIQNELTADAAADEAGRLLDDRPAWVQYCRDVRVQLTGSESFAVEPPSERVAELLSPWLS